ncbi:MAG: T9SS type A sorting domain-containing protein [Bacteroidetes bacterium]|nr:T9SS type A sorting domain-containing protein [Bacteroidota bacterium]
MALIDSSGTTVHQIELAVADSNPKVVAFSIDTITQHLCITEQSESNSAYYMHLKVFDYNLNYMDSLTWGVTKSSSLGIEVFGGGIDTANNKFIVYRSKDMFDQMWNRSICRKNAAGVIKNNIVKIGQAANDGFYINQVVITPTGNIYIAGTRKESLYGNFFYVERLNANFTTIFEVKDQLVLNSIDNNHVSSIHVTNATANSPVLVGGTLYGLAPGDTMVRCHGVIRTYTSNGVLKWNFQNYEVRDYKLVKNRFSHVYAAGTNNKVPSGLDTKITRLHSKDGTLDWNRYYENKSIPICLEVEADKSFLIGGEKQSKLTLPSGAILKVRSYMLIRYSKTGKRLYDYEHAWEVSNEPTSIQAAISDIATGYNQFYYAAGSSRVIQNNSGVIATFDSTSVIQFTNGSLRTGDEIPAEVSLNIRPNPAKGSLLFTCESQVTDLIIYSMAGQIMKTESIDQDGITYTCNIGHLSPGTYVLRVMANKTWHTSKFVKE